MLPQIWLMVTQQPTKTSASMEQNRYRIMRAPQGTSTQGAGINELWYSIRIACKLNNTRKMSMMKLKQYIHPKKSEQIQITRQAFRVHTSKLHARRRQFRPLTNDRPNSISNIVNIVNIRSSQYSQPSQHSQYRQYGQSTSLSVGS